MRRRALIAFSLMVPSALAAQSRSAPDLPDGVMFEFMGFADRYGNQLVAAFDAIPEARYGYRPTSIQQTVGYIAQHLENANYSLCDQIGSLKHRRTSKDALADTVKARWPKDTLVARLEASLRFCDSALARVPALDSPALAVSLLRFETDLAEHYSQISNYMRLIGLVPPTALPPRARTAISLPASALSPLVGVYDLATGMELEVTLKGGALFIRSNLGGAPVQFWPETGADFFAKATDVQVTFVRDASGTVSGLVLHQYGRDRSAMKRR